MKILHIVAGLGQGGAEKQLTLLCRESAGRAEHEVIAAREEGPHAADLRRHGVTVECLRAASLSGPSLLYALAQRIRGSRPDVVHCWLPSMNVMGGLAACLAYPDRPAVIASVRNVDDWKRPLRIAFDRQAGRLWDRVLCNSQAGVDCARRQGIPEGKLHWVPNGVEARAPIGEEERARIRHGLGVPEGEFLLVSACRLVAQKRVHLTLSLVRSLRPRFPGLRLLVCGAGPLAENLREQTVSLGLEREVSFAGAVADPWPLLCASDALVMTSVREGTSNTLLEAMQAGCAVFATRAGDNAALIGRDAGWAGEMEAMPAAIENTLSAPALLARYRTGARVRAREFSTSRMASATLGHYESVLRARHSSPRVLAAMGKGK